MTKPRIPPRIARIDELAYNLWWSWNAEARALFETLNPAALGRYRAQSGEAPPRRSRRAPRQSRPPIPRSSSDTTP